MAKYKYNGSDERVFPTLGITVQPDSEFEAPEGFIAEGVALASTGFNKPKPTMSAPSDKTVGE
jgi:hypothetical protein